MIEDKVNIALGLAASVVIFVTAGVASMRYNEHLACKAVAKQEETMQKAWDDNHPDGFTPNGDQMRPASFDCSVQERPFKPLISYTNPAQYY